MRRKKFGKGWETKVKVFGGVEIAERGSRGIEDGKLWKGEVCTS